LVSDHFKEAFGSHGALERRLPGLLTVDRGLSAAVNGCHRLRAHTGSTGTRIVLDESADERIKARKR
jgi:hypothetical protein